MKHHDTLGAVALIGIVVRKPNVKKYYINGCFPSVDNNWYGIWNTWLYNLHKFIHWKELLLWQINKLQIKNTLKLLP